MNQPASNPTGQGSVTREENYEAADERVYGSKANTTGLPEVTGSDKIESGNPLADGGNWR
jgi:hypothetical protein